MDVAVNASLSSTEFESARLEPTAYHLVVRAKSKTYKVLHNAILIDRMEKREERGQGTLLKLTLKDLSVLQVLFPSGDMCLEIEGIIRRGATVESVERLYPFQYAAGLEKSTVASEGWHVFSPEEEFARMGLPDKMFRLSTMNEDFSLCGSYPKLLAVPAALDADTLREVAKFRQFDRLPMLSYIHPSTRAPLFVAGQPLVGSHGNRCYEDERFFRTILDACADPSRDRRGLIIDLRTASETSAQKGKGGGVEDEKHYFDWQVVNARVGKIKDLDDGMMATFDAVQSEEGSSSSFLSKIDSSQWLHNVKTLLSASVVVSRTLAREQLPVVVHGTAGCDLAAQVSSLAQLLLDPYFRTYEGFQKLIEKEWLHAGHPFTTRCNHFNSPGKKAFKSPVFAMWLDAVWQCTKQFPWEFEFNERFLLLLARHTTSSEFGTFLYDTEKERLESGVRTKTVSLWSFLNVADEKKLLSNPVWQPSSGWLKPSCKPESMKVWMAFFGQGTPYHHFHEEVDELLVFLNDRGNLLSEEVDRKTDELAVLAKELAAEQCSLEEETAASGGGVSGSGGVVTGAAADAEE